MCGEVSAIKAEVKLFSSLRHPTPIVSGFLKSRPYRNFNPRRLRERGICPITRDCSSFHKCGVTKLHFILAVHSCVIYFEANLTPHVNPSLWVNPSLKQPSNVDVIFSVVSIYCQTTVHSKYWLFSWVIRYNMKERHYFLTFFCWK